MTVAVLSPCVGVCVLDAGGCCIGCHRRVDEIVSWSSMQPHERQYLMDVVLPEREAQRE